MTRSAVIVCLLVAGVQSVVYPQSGPDSPDQSEPVKWHRFWDAENLGLFAGVAAVRTLDYTSTRYFRRRGMSEALLTNDVVDNKSLFATIEIAGTAASIGFSYLFHAMGHHRLERWMSIVHISVGGYGAIRNYHISWSRPVLP